MEADAKHDFQASAADELPFCKNTVLKVGPLYFLFGFERII